MLQSWALTLFQWNLTNLMCVGDHRPNTSAAQKSRSCSSANRQWCHRAKGRQQASSVQGRGRQNKCIQCCLPSSGLPPAGKLLLRLADSSRCRCKKSFSVGDFPDFSKKVLASISTFTCACDLRFSPFSLSAKNSEYVLHWQVFEEEFTELKYEHFAVESCGKAMELPLSWKLL